MNPPPGLYAIQEPEAPLATNVVELNGIRSYPHGLTTPRALGAPWPRQVDWSTFSQKIGA
jgi:hypothetical protein